MKVKLEFTTIATQTLNSYDYTIPYMVRDFFMDYSTLNLFISMSNKSIAPSSLACATISAVSFKTCSLSTTRLEGVSFILVGVKEKNALILGTVTISFSS